MLHKLRYITDSHLASVSPAPSPSSGGSYARGPAASAAGKDAHRDVLHLGVSLNFRILFLPEPIPGLPIPLNFANGLLVLTGRTRIPLSSLSNSCLSPGRTPSTRRTSRGTAMTNAAGIATRTDRLSADPFVLGEARSLGVQAQGQAEQHRVLLAVPTSQTVDQPESDFT